MERIRGSYVLFPLKYHFKRVSKASAQEGHKQGFCVPGSSDTAPFYEGLIKNPLVLVDDGAEGIAHGPRAA